MSIATFIILKTHLSDEVSRTIISDECRQALEKAWSVPDQLLTRISHLPWMENKTRWSQLSREQIQTVIALHMTTRDGLSPDKAGLVSKSLQNALVALIIALEQGCGWVTCLTVNHLGPMHLEVEVAMSIGVKYEGAPPPPPRAKVRIVVENP